MKDLSLAPHTDRSWGQVTDCFQKRSKTCPTDFDKCHFGDASKFDASLKNLRLFDTDRQYSKRQIQAEPADSCSATRFVRLTNSGMDSCSGRRVIMEFSKKEGDAG